MRWFRKMSSSCFDRRQGGSLAVDSSFSRASLRNLSGGGPSPSPKGVSGNELNRDEGNTAGPSSDRDLRRRGCPRRRADGEIRKKGEESHRQRRRSLLLRRRRAARLAIAAARPAGVPRDSPPRDDARATGALGGSEGRRRARRRSRERKPGGE